MRFHENVFVRLLDGTIERMLQAFAVLMPAAASLDRVEAIRSEVRDIISEVKTQLTQPSVR